MLTLPARHLQGFFEANPLGVPGLPDYADWRRHESDGGPPAKPPPPPPGLHFAMCFTDNAVLQRAPAKAALYGRVVPPPAAGAVVEVAVTPALAGKSTFEAEMFADGTWKVLLPPTEAGGDYSATASCGSTAFFWLVVKETHAERTKPLRWCR